jgi:hypothetical protein
MDLRMGFRACGPPAWDPGFGCYDLLVLGRRERLGGVYTGVINRIERQLRAAQRATAEVPPPVTDRTFSQ